MKQDKGELDEPRLDEYWVGFDSFPNYVVSNYGRVINLKSGEELKQTSDLNGYLHVKLIEGDRKVVIVVHRLVAKAFFLNYKDGIQVKHINGDFSDNTVLNLTLGTKQVRLPKDRDWT